MNFNFNLHPVCYLNSIQEFKRHSHYNPVLKWHTTLHSLFVWHGLERRGVRGVVSSFLREQTDTKACPLLGSFWAGGRIWAMLPIRPYPTPLIQGGFGVSGGLQTSHTHAALIGALQITHLTRTE